MSGLDVEAVLRDHAFVISGICACGENVGLTHRAHVAAVLRVEIESALAEAWDAGYYVGVAHAQMPPGVPFKANPHRPKSGQFTVTSTVNPDMAKAIVEMLRDHKRRTGLDTLGL